MAKIHYPAGTYKITFRDDTSIELELKSYEAKALMTKFLFLKRFNVKEVNLIKQ